MESSAFKEKVQRLQELFRLPENEAIELLKRHDDLERVIAYMETSGRLGGLEGGGSIVRSPGDVNVSRSDRHVSFSEEPIDLTKDARDQDIQKALMLSMQDIKELPAPESGVVSLEEQELSRALEASLRESNAGMSKPVLALFQDPKNPHKRRRVGSTPVGLKNIGNTCWFSAVIQSLFQIPVFQAEILSYSPPEMPSGTTSHSQCVTFVLELQKIFVLLLKSDRMYIDPSPAILSLREAFSKEHSLASAQQDVSEFTHKLLEWIENAFKALLEDSSADRRCNPIVRLFNGHYRTEGVSNNQRFVNESDFGAYPVQVRGHTHLHDSLDSATFDMDMQQQTFFSRFPPILVLELSRFHYNQTTQQAEKIHDRLDFDLQLCVDRYLEENKEESCRKKKDVDQLRRRIKELENRLHCYTHYNERQISITDVLSLALNFVKDQTSWEYDGGGGVEEKEERQAEKRARVSLYPSPRYCSQQEQDVLGACLTRWAQELHQEMDELHGSIETAKASLEAIYNDPLMKKTPYFLHSVLVHQGEASGGHYWAYTRKHPSLDVASHRTPSASSSSSSSSSKPGFSSTPDLQMMTQGTSMQQHSQGDSTFQIGTGGVDRAGASGEAKSTSETSLVVKDSKASLDVRTLTYHRQSETGEVCVDVAHSMESILSAEEEVVSTELPETPSHVRETGDSCGGSSRGGGSLPERSEKMEIEKYHSTSSLSVEPPSSTLSFSQFPPNSGSPAEGSWIKFNDVSVSEVKWEEVRRESVGGTSGNTSAYCLVYINQELHQDWVCSAKELELRDDLVQYASEDNIAFSKEIEEYDRNIEIAGHISKSSATDMEHPPSPLAMMSPGPDTGAAMASCATVSPPNPRRAAAPLLAHCDAAPTAEERAGSQELMQVDSPPPPAISPTLQTKLTSLVKARQCELSQLENKYEEPRIKTLSAFVLYSNLSKRCLRLLLLNEVASTCNNDAVKFLAKREIMHDVQANTEMKSIQECYQLFLNFCWYFVMAIKAAKEASTHSFDKSLLMCLKAFQQHKVMQESHPSAPSLRPAHLYLLRRLRSKSLQQVSTIAFKKFESTDIQDGLRTATALVVPALSQISCEVGGEDEGQDEEVVMAEEVGVVEKVREEWCQCLNRPHLTEAEQDRVGDLLTSLLDDGGSKAFNLPDVGNLQVDAATLVEEFSALVGQLPQLLGAP